MCAKHYAMFKKTGRNTAEGEESENRELTDDGKFAYILEPKLFYNIVCSFLNPLSLLTEERMKKALVQRWKNMEQNELCDEIENIFNTFDDDPPQILFNEATARQASRDLLNRLHKWLRDYPLSFLSLNADEDSKVKGDDVE